MSLCESALSLSEAITFNTINNLVSISSTTKVVDASDSYDIILANVEAISIS